MEFVILKAELASPFPSPSCTQPRPASHLFCKILLDWSCLISLTLEILYFYTVLLSPSSLSMTLGTKMALSHSHLVPARKPSACQAPARHRRTSRSAREVLPCHGRSQNSHLIINHPDQARQATMMKAKIAALPNTTCARRGGQEEVRG